MTRLRKLAAYLQGGKKVFEQ